MRIRDYGGNNDEVIFSGSIIIPARDVITAGDSLSFNFTTSISLTNTYEDLVLYDAENIELDVIIYGNSITNTYPWGPGSGWIGPENATGGLTSGYSLNRLNGSNYEYKDTNSSADWVVMPISPGIKTEYIEPATAGSVLITELMINVDDDFSEIGGEYIELYNPTDSAVDLSFFTIRRSNYWSDPEAELPGGTIIPAKTYLTLIEDYSVASSLYDIVGSYLEIGQIVLTDSDPSDVLLVDFYNHIIDHIAWRTSSQNYTNTIDPLSWTDEGVYKGSDGQALARLYDPYNNDKYIDSNSSDDWRYNVYPSIGLHTNTTFFLSTPVSGDSKIYTFCSPDNSYNALKFLFGKAKKSIDICVYQFTSVYLLNELEDAMNRGVKVRLILEDGYPGGSVYTGGDSVAHESVYIATVIDAHENGSVRWESKKFFTYTHAKYCIIDNETIIVSTENFKATGIPRDNSAGNRGWGIAVNNTKIAKKYLAVYNFDWSIASIFDKDEVIAPSANYDIIEGNYEPYDDDFDNDNIFDVSNAKLQTVIGRDEAINVIVDLINKANESLYAELFYLFPTWSGYFGGENNNPFLKALLSAAQRGVKIKIIFDSTFYNIDGDNNNDEAATILKAHGIEVQYSKNENGIEKFHVKAFIIDEKIVMISSMNWAENSATNNREIGIIVFSSQVASFYVGLFEYDWDKLSTSDLSELTNATEDINTYTWVVWLPILTTVFIIFSIGGYLLRYRKEESEYKRRVAKDKAKELSRNIKAELIEAKKSIPINLEEIRNALNYVYGATVWISHLDSKGMNLDEVEPSDFVRLYIEKNHNLIKTGEPLNPLPEIVILKYGPNNYIAIESYLNLTVRLFELQNILHLWGN